MREASANSKGTRPNYCELRGASKSVPIRTVAGLDLQGAGTERGLIFLIYLGSEIQRSW